LCAFANYGWRDADRQDLKGNPINLLTPLERWPENLRKGCEAAAEWFWGRRAFRRMLPNETPLGVPLAVRVYYHQRGVRLVWLADSAELRKREVTNLLAGYGAVMLMGRRHSWGMMDFAGHLERLSAAGDGRIGIWPDGFMQALRHALENALRMRVCANPNCHHPFFFGSGKDRYCSKACAMWGKRRSNLESWRKNWKRWPSSRWRAKGGRKKYLGKGKRQ
jgi:hypothetical protein